MLKPNLYLTAKVKTLSVGMLNALMTFSCQQSVASPICKKMAQQFNQYDGSFHSFSQFDSEVTTLSYHQF